MQVQSDWRTLKIPVELLLRTCSEAVSMYAIVHADTMLLSAMYLAVGRSLQISPSQLGTLSMWRGLVTVRGC